MSIDGPGIIASDLAHDIYNKILDLYDAGVSIDEIRTRISSCEHELHDEMELEIYLAASAKAFWEIGQLEKSHLDRLAQLIDGGTSLALWNAPGDSLERKRKFALLRFVRQIAVTRAKPRPRKKYPTFRKKLFSVGDCLQLEGKERIHRAIVCKILEQRGRCDYAMLVMSTKTMSTVDSFRSGKYYGHAIPTSLRPSGVILGPHVIRPDHRMLVKAGNPFQVVGHLDLDSERFMLGSFGGVLEMKDVFDDFERTETKAAIFNQELLPVRALLLGEPEPTFSPV